MSGHKVVPTIHSRLGHLNKLKERTHNPSTTPTETTPTETTPTSTTPTMSDVSRPVPAPRRPRSPVNISQPHPSNNGDVKPHPIPKKRTLPMMTSSPAVSPGTSPGMGRVSAYSHGSKEYKQHKKDSIGTSPSGIGTSPSGMGMSPSGGIGMSPSGIGIPPPDASLIGIIDMESCPSLMMRYEKNEEERIQLSEVANFKFDDHTRPSSKSPDGIPPHLPPSPPLSRPKSPGPPKPPRQRKTSDPTTPPTSRKTLPTTDHGATDTSPRLSRSASDYSGISVSGKTKSSGGGFIERIRKSPILGRKKSSTNADMYGDDESVISQAAILKTKRSPLHLVPQRNINEMLKNPSIEPNGRDDEGATPLHYYVTKPRKSRHTLLKRCLQSGRDFDIDARDSFDNTPLHEAAKRDDINYVKILTAFGAKLFLKNHQGKYPFQLAPPYSATYRFLTNFPEPPDNHPFSLSSLPDSTNSLNIDELRNKSIGELMQPQNSTVLARMIDDEIVRAERMFHPTDDQSSFSQQMFDDNNAMVARTQQRFYLNGWKKTAGNRVLFLDGGGIRGLIQIEILMELEQRTGCRIVELFDWIIGTSTGGIVALGLVYANKTLAQMKQIYFQIKNHVFAGTGLAGAFLSMGPKSQKMEEILKRELGEAPLISVQKPRVMICVANKTELPVKVQFFNNFMIEEDEELCNIPVWKAARATSAAPIYFTPCDGKYVDGGVKANNPCQEAMTVIKKYDESKGIPERHFLLMMSIGTGIYPVKELVGGDIDKGTILKRHIDHARQLVDLFTDCIGESEPAAQNFAAYCSGARIPIPFYRFNPQLNDVVIPGETDDDKVIELILNTKLYLVQESVSAKLDELVSLFRRLSTQSLQ